MAKVKMTLAVAHYDRHMPFLDGTAEVEGVDLTVLEVGQSIPGRDGVRRHEQMLQDGAFEAAEVSLSAYLMARDRQQPFIAIPVIPRRLFCQSLFFCRQDSPLRGPEDLAGKRVGINTYQTTLSVLAKGDLDHEYGVDWKSITWVINNDEIIAFPWPEGVKTERVPKDRKVDQLLLDGEVDAAVLPHPPSTLIGNRGQVRRVVPNPRHEEQRYYQKHGYWPIMHFVVLRQDVVDQYPWAPRAFYDAFVRAKEKALWHWEDPNWSLLAWGRHYLEEEQTLMNGDPWPYGLQRNRANIERFMGYSQEQGLISATMHVESLFHESVLDT